MLSFILAGLSLDPPFSVGGASGLARQGAPRPGATPPAEPVGLAPGRCASHADRVIQASGLQDTLRVRPDNPDRRPAITQNGGSRLIWIPAWSRLVLLAAFGFGLVFAAGDGRELVHQLDEPNTGLASVAAILLVLHLAVAGIAGFLPRPRSPSGVAAAQPS